MTLDIRYRAPPALARMLRSDAPVRCVVGPFGSGKSSGCVVEILRRSLQQAPQADGKRRSRWVVVRNTYRELHDTTARTFADWIPEGVLGRWVKQDFTFQLRFGEVEADVLFRALDSPEDVKKLLSLELTGAYINELREIPKAILDGLDARVGRYPAVKDGGCTWSGIWADTNPWHLGHWGYKLFSKERPPGYELYEQPSGLSAEAENKENLKPGYYERMSAGKDKEWVDMYVHGLYGSSDKGSVYGALLDGRERAGAVADYAHPLDGVHVVFDLGVSDATAMWWLRVGGRADGRRGVDFLDYYEATGQGAEHYFGVLDQRAKDCGYEYRHLWFPHDAKARTWATETTPIERARAECRRRRWGAAEASIGPQLTLEQGLSAGRWLLEAEQETRFHTRCAQGLEMLREYRFEWDDEARVFSKKPLHNFASHAADAYRYSAIIAKLVLGLERQAQARAEAAARKREPDVRSLDNLGVLDELWDTAYGGESPTGRI